MSERPVRLVYAAAHVVYVDDYADVPHSVESPGASEEIARYVDWPATLAFRRRLDALGFGIAEAMDTAQRFSIGWLTASKLIEETGAMKLAHGFVAGAGVDHLAPTHDRDALIEAVAWQARFIRERGGLPMILPLVALTETRADEDEYVRTYAAIFERIDGPVFVHWLGEMFLPSLAGYFPGRSFDRVMALDPSKVRGAKLSLLDRELELRMRRDLLARDQIVLTGDDFNFADLVRGDARSSIARWTTIDGREVALGDFSHALLGAFDGVAEPASRALDHLARGEYGAYDKLMGPCEALSRAIFEPPTRFYKSGLAHLAWRRGLQSNAMLANHEEQARTAEHYQRVAQLAVEAGVL